MSKQLTLFDPRIPHWVWPIWDRIDPAKRRQVLAILAGIARSPSPAISPCKPRRQPMNPSEIAASHRSRLAFVFVRQSTQHQVVHHLESQRRQRSLPERAADLGWNRDLIRVVDEDLAQSAARCQDRTGFQKMVAEAALGNIGVILALEVSRLSRNSRDWYHLLDICAVTQILLADAEGLYDPRAYNDRLLLGLKGTMKEAELHIMKQRLVEAIHAKAKRGEFRFRLSMNGIKRAAW